MLYPHITSHYMLYPHNQNQYPVTNKCSDRQVTNIFQIWLQTAANNGDIVWSATNPVRLTSSILSTVTFLPKLPLVVNVRYVGNLV